jgi:hypothetical protein
LDHTSVFGVFAVLDPGGLGTGVATAIADTQVQPYISRMNWTNLSKELNIIGYDSDLSNGVFTLDSVPPMSIR